MALSKDTLRKHRGEPRKVQVAIGTAATLYVGSLVNRRTTTGRVLAATAATGRKFFGVVERLDGPNGESTGTGVGNTSGTQKALIRYNDEFLVTIATAIRTNTSLGLNLFVGDDDKCSGTAVGTAGTRVPVGELVAFEASDKSTGWVRSRQFALSNIAV